MANRLGIPNNFGPTQKIRSGRGEYARQKNNAYNAAEFIAENPKRVAALRKQNEDANARRQHALSRKNKIRTIKK
jgi:hypothetical protein